MGALFGTIFLGTMFFIMQLVGEQNAYKKMEEQKLKDDIEDLKNRFRR